MKKFSFRWHQIWWQGCLNSTLRALYIRSRGLVHVTGPHWQLKMYLANVSITIRMWHVNLFCIAQHVSVFLLIGRLPNLDDLKPSAQLSIHSWTKINERIPLPMTLAWRESQPHVGFELESTISFLLTVSIMQNRTGLTSNYVQAKTICNIMAEGFRFMLLGLVRLRTFQLSA